MLCDVEREMNSLFHFSLTPGTYSSSQLHCDTERSSLAEESGFSVQQKRLI